MCEQMDSVLQEIFLSSEMASYLARHTLSRERIRDMIAYAAIPLKRKRSLFLQLASGKNTSYFRRQASCIEQAMREMQPTPGSFFYLKSCHCSEEDQMEKGLEPYLTWEYIHERIREFLGYLSADEQEQTWFEVEKWSPDGTGKLKNEYDYMVFGAGICYFSHNTSSRRDWRDFSVYNDLNLPVPFRAGDILTVDCRPFVPVSHIVLLDVGDNQDCCCLQALFRESDGTWSTGAVKHGHVFPNHQMPGVSPLYRLSIFHGPLPEEECLLKKVRQYIDADETRGPALWNYIYNLCKDKKKQTVTEEQILSYMTSNVHT